MTTLKQCSTSGIEYAPRTRLEHLPIPTFASSVHRGGFDGEERCRSAGQSYSAIAKMTRPAADLKFSRPRVQRLSPLFSSTSWREWFNSFVLINIVERRKLTFFLHLFSITFRLRPPIFRGLFSDDASHRGLINYLIFNNIDFCEVFAIHC